MDEKRAVDQVGAVALFGFAALLAFNQVVIKTTGDGFGPVFQAGLRSTGATAVLLIWMRWRHIRIIVPKGVFGLGILLGLVFSYEFLLLFIALDMTTVSRASVIFYTMPVWLALSAHILLPGEKLTVLRSLGLVAAVLGVGVALLDRSQGAGNLTGDLLALAAAVGWAAIALMVRATRLSTIPPEIQLLFQLGVSAIVLTGAAPFFGDLFRTPQPVHWAGLGFQIICVASFGFLAWFWLMKIYRASDVASFSFLSPVIAVIFGWLLLGEDIDLQIWLALGLVVTGLFLINQK